MCNRHGERPAAGSRPIRQARMPAATSLMQPCHYPARNQFSLAGVSTKSQMSASLPAQLLGSPPFLSRAEHRNRISSQAKDDAETDKPQILCQKR
jgi:hypothetical protein